MRSEDDPSSSGRENFGLGALRAPDKEAPVVSLHGDLGTVTRAQGQANVSSSVYDYDPYERKGVP